jgi:hypothetical protein
VKASTACNCDPSPASAHRKWRKVAAASTGPRATSTLSFRWLWSRSCCAPDSQVCSCQLYTYIHTSLCHKPFSYRRDSLLYSWQYITHTVGRNPTDVVAGYNHGNITHICIDRLPNDVILGCFCGVSASGLSSYYCPLTSSGLVLWSQVLASWSTIILIGSIAQALIILVTSLFPRFAVWSNWLVSWSAIIHSYWRNRRRGLP